MTYYGFLLRTLSWQANEEEIIKQYLAIIDRCQPFCAHFDPTNSWTIRLEARYPKGALWILNRVGS